ncbi:MAG: AAA family ATPase [Gammaproteobacteria bacterium]|nr:AAA family ATPase [Gammaproteobacteria bacterium]
MKIIAIYNIKGGVGKTATAVNLSYLASLDGANTLLWDLDPQGAASYYCRIKPKIKGGGKKLVEGKIDIDEVVKGTDYENLDLLPADFSYRNMDMFLQSTKQPLNRLNKLLGPLAEEYDYVFLDCPPSISAASESVFTAADILLVPTIPTTLSLRTYKQIMHFLKQQNTGHAKVLPFFVMVDGRKKMHRLIVQHPPSFMPTLLKSYIPYASEVERMGTHRAPVAIFAPGSKAAGRYQSLWNELRPQLW